MDRVKLNFGATIITEHPFTPDAMQQLLAEAKAMILAEEKLLAKGTEPEEWDSEENKAKYLKPVPKTAGNAVQPERQKEIFSEEDTPGLKRRSTKMANLVEAMMMNSVTAATLEGGEKNSSVKKQKNGVNGISRNGETDSTRKEDLDMTTSRTCVIL